jgi:biotin carboxyl carrier protein
MELRKKYILRRGDEESTATLVRDGGGRVWVESSSGQKIDDAIVLDNGRSVSLRLNNRMYFVDVTPRHHRELRALINGRGGVVQLFDELGAAAAEQESVGNSGRELKADMPGLVVDIKCAVGDQVMAGQPIVVLEAMKMQNELTSPGDGTVEEILVQAGQSVESGALLLRLAEPAPEPEPEETA